MSKAEFIYVNDVPRILECPICWNPYYDPVQCPNGHIFCWDCIENSIAKKSECPICRTFVMEEDLTDNLLARTLTDELLVSCVFKGKCKWQGLRSALSDHLDNCPCQPIECSLGCGVIVQRRLMDQHEKHSCVFRSLECPICHQCVPAGDHVECPNEEIPCRNTGCSVILRRFELSRHDARCPFKRLPCPTHSIRSHKTCKGYVLRKDLKTHLRATIRVLEKLPKLRVRSKQK